MFSPQRSLRNLLILLLLPFTYSSPPQWQPSYQYTPPSRSKTYNPINLYTILPTITYYFQTRIPTLTSTLSLKIPNLEPNINYLTASLGHANFPHLMVNIYSMNSILKPLIKVLPSREIPGLWVTTGS